MKILKSPIKSTRPNSNAYKGHNSYSNPVLTQKINRKRSSFRSENTQNSNLQKMKSNGLIEVEIHQEEKQERVVRIHENLIEKFNRSASCPDIKRGLKIKNFSNYSLNMKPSKQDASVIGIFDITIEINDKNDNKNSV